jgi:hypothetical protein
MTDFTPENLIENLNKNYPNIMESAYQGYLEAFKIEQALLNLDMDFNFSDSTNTSNETLLFLTNLAATSQYLKKYFLMEIVTNSINMQFLNMYISVMSSAMEPKNTSSASIEELPDDSEQTGGAKSPLTHFINTFIVLLFITIITNASNIGNSLTFPNQDSGVSINIKAGQIPKLSSSITGVLNPLDENQMQTFAKEFGQNIVFPESKTIKSESLTDSYGPAYVTQKKLSKPEREQLINFISDVSINDDILINFIEMLTQKFELEQSPLLLNIRREGIML